MKIKEISKNKEDFIEILLIGDESIGMIKKYLNKASLFALYNDVLVSICAVLENDNDIEIKNLATYPKFQNQGYASKLLNFIFKKYKGKTIILGTGENIKTLDFYRKRGFIEFKRVENFFVDNYPNSIFEDGRQLIDMIYLKKDNI